MALERNHYAQRGNAEDVKTLNLKFKNFYRPMCLDAPLSRFYSVCQRIVYIAVVFKYFDNRSFVKKGEIFYAPGCKNSEIRERNDFHRFSQFAIQFTHDCYDK